MYTIGSEGLREIFSSRQFELRWKTIHEIAKTASMFLLYVSLSCTVNLPKRFFA